MKNQESGQNTAAEKISSDLTTQVLRKMRRVNTWMATSRRDAWGEINRANNGGGKERNPRKLSNDEAVMLATNLHRAMVEHQPRLKELKVNKTDLCKAAFGGIDSKELYRITLPPGTDPAKRGLRVTVEKYISFIEALSNALDANVRLIAEPILRGTRFHPFSRTDSELSDLDKILELLQRIVDELDRESGWFETYRRTARLKCQGVKEGDKVCWPLDAPYPLTEIDSSDDGREEYRQAFEMASDPNQAFMRRNRYGTATGCGGLI